MKIEYVKKCMSCKGTGIYIGFAERDGFGIICHECEGTGKVHVKIEYEEFIERDSRKGVHTILQSNPGISIGIDKKQGLSKNSFGGMDYETWKKTGIFPKGSEMRIFICPAWWYQNTDYKKKPKWKECNQLGGYFSDCKNFKTKGKCWEKFDKENN